MQRYMLVAMVVLTMAMAGIACQAAESPQEVYRYEHLTDAEASEALLQESLAAYENAFQEAQMEREVQVDAPVQLAFWGWLDDLMYQAHRAIQGGGRTCGRRCMTYYPPHRGNPSNTGPGVTRIDSEKKPHGKPTPAATE